MSDILDKRALSQRRRRKAIELRAGQRTYRDIGSALGVSRQRAHQMTKQPVRPDASEAHPLLNQYRDVFERTGVDELTIAEAIRALTAAGITQSQIAEAYDKKTSWVSFYQKLNRMPSSLVAYLRDDRVKATTLVKCVERCKDDALVERIIKAIVSEHRRNNYTGRITAREILERVPA